MQYALPDGKVVRGRSYADIVRNMAGEKFTPVRSIERYRRATAKRIRSLYGERIDTTDDRSFVLTMLEAGMLRVVK